MSWFDEQIRQAKRNDQEVLEDSLFHMASVVLERRNARAAEDDRIVTKAAVEEILKYYHLKAVEVPENIREFDEQLDYSLRPYGIMRRKVVLSEGWYRDCFGPVLAFYKEDGRPAALLPRPSWGYSYADPNTGKSVPIGKKNEQLFKREAICFYRPLPQGPLKKLDLLTYMKDCLSASDFLIVLILSLLATLAGMLVPLLTKFLTGAVLESGKAQLFVGTAVYLLCALTAREIIGAVRQLSVRRMETKTSLCVEAALMARLMCLPACFFRKYSSGELSSRFASIGQLCRLLIGDAFALGISSVFSLAFIGQIFHFTPALAVPALLSILSMVSISLIASFLQKKISIRLMEAQAKTEGLAYSLLNGVQKIKLSGAEKRVFARWAHSYAAQTDICYNTPLFLRINRSLFMAAGLVFTLVMYYLAVRERVTPSEYISFYSAYGMVMGAFTALSEVAVNVARIQSILEMIEPILKAEPESAHEKAMVHSLRGMIELSHVSFRYQETMPYVINDLSLKIKAGEYIAIVGQTGCGKSTLMRLLLGFEKPQRGAVYYDGKDMANLDKRSLRQCIGAVTQDGSLFQGSIYSNIVLSAPRLTLEDAWAAAETAGIADDIRAMPMQMHTVIGEGQGGISGGQKQRLMIARAIAPKPKILFFDEATSALDNLTQKQVAEALDQMKCTRVVIAHRLSTIKNCDRILLLEDGKIAEEGTYEELLNRKGRFAALVERQMLSSREGQH